MEQEPLSKEDKLAQYIKRRHIEMAIIIPLIVLIVGGVIFGIIYFIHAATMFTRGLSKALADYAANRVVERVYYDDIWQYTLYSKESDPDYAYVVVEGFGLSIFDQREIVLPREIDGNRVKEFSFKYNDSYTGKVFYDSCYTDIISLRTCLIEDCEGIIVGNGDFLIGYASHLFEKASKIYVNDVCYQLAHTATWTKDINVCKANVSYMLNYEDTDAVFVKDYYYCFPYEMPDDVAEEYEKARTLEESEAVFIKYNAVRVYLNEYNNGYYWIDNLNIGDKILTIPQKPQRAGYTFVCWCLDEAGTQPFDFNTYVKADSDLVLYAKWMAE